MPSFFLPPPLAAVNSAGAHPAAPNSARAVLHRTHFPERRPKPGKSFPHLLVLARASSAAPCQSCYPMGGRACMFDRPDVSHPIPEVIEPAARQTALLRPRTGLHGGAARLSQVIQGLVEGSVRGGAMCLLGGCSGTPRLLRGWLDGNPPYIERGRVEQQDVVYRCIPNARCIRLGAH